MAFQNPLLPECFLHWTEPPGTSGDEIFRVVSWRRSITLKGHSFREFSREVVPLLDGRHSLDQICSEVADVFDRDDLVAALEMLASQGIVVEGGPPDIADLPAALTPQLGWLAEAAPEGRAAQRWLTEANVVIFGAGAHGASAARSLAAAGVGTIVLVDPAVVGASDPYFSAMFRQDELGQNRAEVLARALEPLAPENRVVTHTSRPSDVDEIAGLIDGSSLVVCCLESGELNLALKLNRACRNAAVKWIAGSMEGTELVVGPGFAGDPDEPCYMCWRMREVAAAANPQARFALEKRLDRFQQDLSSRRENLAAGADIVGGMMAAEAVSILTGAGEPSLNGRFLVIEVPGLRVEKHTVLRKPGCPVCGGGHGLAT